MATTMDHPSKIEEIYKNKLNFMTTGIDIHHVNDEKSKMEFCKLINNNMELRIFSITTFYVIFI